MEDTTEEANAPLLPGLPTLNDVYDLYHNNKLEEFAEAADELLETRNDLIDVHRIQLKCLLISVTQHDRLKQLFRIDGSDDPAYEDKLQVVDEVVECAQRAMQRKAARFFGPEEVEEEEEDMMDMESDDEGDDEDTIVADTTVDEIKSKDHVQPSAEDVLAIRRPPRKTSK
ncbi:unnamed protein product [Zymoseptoria tritici ST99CH_3D7]|uniref:Uncharacterized protein n=1 Tax=Zymoseptoria tritici (strain ST99CH_3D7) TaxID=1276538 RepID=A0A1X7RXX0_ZYMT9|nr:unnamed protein product [Zymoseptoria tritici ST99CH_3D7]